MSLSSLEEKGFFDGIPYLFKQGTFVPMKGGTAGKQTSRPFPGKRGFCFSGVSITNLKRGEAYKN